MKKIVPFILIILFSCNNLSLAQFNKYSIKYGIQGQLLQPRTEFDTDAYHLSLLGRGFLRTEINSYLETEIGVGIGELNGKDFLNNKWSTLLFPVDFRLVFSPLSLTTTNPYIYWGISLIRWNVSDFPESPSPEKTEGLGWDSAIPLGGGIEILLNDEVLLDISVGYNFALMDNLNYYNKPDANDGYFNFGFGLTFVVGGGTKDQDLDGLNQEFERKIGTDPNNNDTDGDKLFDGDEVNYFNTNPLKEDTDGDGLNDFQEISLHSSDPKSTDTDGDDLGDYDEVNTYKTNPNLKDTDGDGLSDGYEVNIYQTNPALSDTDGDILEDNDELKKYKTDPLNPDTDGDGMLDGDEINKYNTNPLIKDALEKTKTTKKNIPYISSKQAVVLEGISFETNKAEIKSESKKVLNKTFLALKNDPTLNIEIRGFTDNVGDASYNKKLSQDRADAVRIWLVQKGIDALRIKASGYGESNPISDNSTPDGRNKNRRIEIIRIK